MWCVFALINDATYPFASNQSKVNADNNQSIPGTPDSQGHMGNVLRVSENAWDYVSGISWAHQRYLDLLNMCHNLQYTPSMADQVYKNQGDFKPEASGGKPEP